MCLNYFKLKTTKLLKQSDIEKLNAINSNKNDDTDLDNEEENEQVTLGDDTRLLIISFAADSPYKFKPYIALPYPTPPPIVESLVNTAIPCP